MMIEVRAGMHDFLSDAQWFPVDLDASGRTFQFAKLGLGLVEQANFLDARMVIPWSEGVPIDVSAVEHEQLRQGNIGWIFHTSFCCSTLLARALHLPSYQVCLREPQVLRRLADAKHMRQPVHGSLAASVNLLRRPWHSEGSVVVKPTHAALNIAADLLRAAPGSRGVLLTSSLEDFLLSNMKKSEETQRKIPLLVERAFHACVLGERLPRLAFDPPDILAAAALQWAAQREVCLDILESVGADVLLVIDASELLADVVETTWLCSQWLNLLAPKDALEQRVALVSRNNAKAVDVAYSPQRRETEAKMVRLRYAEHLATAMQWFDRHVLPAMRPGAVSLADARSFAVRCALHV